MAALNRKARSTTKTGAPAGVGRSCTSRWTRGRPIGTMARRKLRFHSWGSALSGPWSDTAVVPGAVLLCVPWPHPRYPLVTVAQDLIAVLHRLGRTVCVICDGFHLTGVL